MKVKVIFYMRRMLYTQSGPIEYVDSETVLDMGELGLIHGCGDHHSYYDSMDQFLSDLSMRRGLNKSQLKVVELGDY